MEELPLSLILHIVHQACIGDNFYVQPSIFKFYRLEQLLLSHIIHPLLAQDVELAKAAVTKERPNAADVGKNTVIF